MSIIEEPVSIKTTGGKPDDGVKTLRERGFIDKHGRYQPRGGELFIHSHYSEPADGLEGDGIDSDDFEAFDRLVDFVVDFKPANEHSTSTERFVSAYAEFISRQ